jgi:hypothetical protein
MCCSFNISVSSSKYEVVSLTSVTYAIYSLPHGVLCFILIAIANMMQNFLLLLIIIIIIIIIALLHYGSKFCSSIFDTNGP